LWDEALDYWWWWSKFAGSCPPVDEIPAWLHVRVPHIENIADEIRKEKSRR
jgi:hypothetical protein